jgi:hypothetical protein
MSFAEYLEKSGIQLSGPVESCPVIDGKVMTPSGGWQNMAIVSSTECWTLKTSESPRDAVAPPPLSEVLATGDLSPLYLSREACAGILRRAKNMGRSYPKWLTTILETQGT